MSRNVLFVPINPLFNEQRHKWEKSWNGGSENVTTSRCYDIRLDLDDINFIRFGDDVDKHE